MNSKLFRWIAFAVCVLLAIIALIVHTATGFLCFAVAAFITIPINRIFGKLDSDLDAKYRKRATFITTIIFFLCGLFAFTTAGSSSAKENSNQAVTTTTAITTEATTTTIPTTISTTTVSTTTETTFTTTIIAETTTTTTIVITEAATEIQQEKNDQNSRTVYITKTGKKYHYSDQCNGGTYYPSTLGEALSKGLTPCNKCVN